MNRALVNLEEHLQLTDNYSSYVNDMKEASLEDKQDSFDQIRYMMAIGYIANEADSSEEIMFIGGLGVIGNLVKHFDTEVINRWRGTRDLDVLVKHISADYLIKKSFDKLDICEKSRSVGNKKTIRGSSYDANNNLLPSATVDVFHPSGNPRQEILVHNTRIMDYHWDERSTASFYGIKINFLSVLPLLDMKLNVNSSCNLPRRQDLQDICHLLSLAEKENIKPRCLSNYLAGNRKLALDRVLSYLNKDNTGIEESLITHCSGKYQRELEK